MNKKKNVLAYVSLVCFAIICGILGFIIGTQSNTSDENGVTNSNKSELNMTKSELNSYIAKFTKYFDLSNEFDNVSEISDYEKLLFAFRVYRKDEYKEQNVVPAEEIKKIVNEYFGVKGFKYEPTSNDKHVKYDNEKNAYIIDNNFRVLSTKTSDGLVTTISNIIDNENGKIIQVKLSGSTVTGEYNILLNDNNNIVLFKKIENNKYEKIDYKIEKTGENEYATYTLKVNGKNVMNVFEDESTYIVQLDDILVLSACADGCDFYVVDKNANVIKDFESLNLKGKIYNHHRVDGNDIIIDTTNIWYGTSNEALCKNINEHKKQNMPVNYEEKITYLGDGKFSEPTLIKSETVEKLEKQLLEDGLDCSKY